ncbi:eukaryotic aspartyl protease (macronuclear) [Tetrahymena thermophila SB210]|uniref:Eukaryotic aspartyl protease n=1 Tax=Tetrahymena thermophila (strain SB210) TaxID=312017 RepID=I7LUH4_TETTS|nr:eukaryotic aspartyl protease [Tetrahymena thermophila SB210]EAR93779.2 eukaryotic aspartyl protease [Tetrahymena thermophila SB210]|eukprot:XP_001014024.2 eukaryotic aspartyl protease [Tetrahymena thermophila SB210]
MNFQSSQFDGILVPAFKQLSNFHNLTIFDQLVAQVLVAQEVFSFYFCDKENSDDYELFLGGIDFSYYSTAYKYYHIFSKLGTLSLLNLKLNIAIGNSSSFFIYGISVVLNLIIKLFPSKIDCTQINTYLKSNQKIPLKSDMSSLSSNDFFKQIKK